VPLIILAPLAAFLIVVSSATTRRGSANTALLGALVSFAATLLVGWGLANRTAPYHASYIYYTTNIAFSGPTNFQNFEVDLVLHVDHLTVFALAVIEASVFLVLVWNRVMGRNEPGHARFQALVTLFLFGAIGTLVSTDLAELFTFWAITGGVTYLLLAHRWGVEAAARAGRIALALPFLTDLFLLCGVAVLYSRYGRQNLADLIPLLHTTPGWTVRQLVVASVLLFVGIGGRMALWPLQSWVTGTVSSAPAAASAIVQAAWPVIGVMVLYRVLPIFQASSPQAMKDLVIACGVSAVVAPLLSLISMEPRRAIALAGSGVAALGAAITIHGFQFPAFTFAVAGVACVCAAAPARAAGVLAATAIVNAMRSEDLRFLGDAWRRMRSSAAVLLLVSIAFGLSTISALALAVDSRSRFGVVLGEAVFLAVLGAYRVFVSAGFGPLRRRRAFDPDRVRDVPTTARGWPYWLALLSIAVGVAVFVTRWLNFLDGKTHAMAKLPAYEVWAVVVLLGFAGGTLALVWSKDGALGASGSIGGFLDALTLRTSAVIDRFILEPTARIADRTGDAIVAGDSAIGRISVASGLAASAAARAPALPVMIVITILLALLIGLLSPGVLR
jgi:NADH:ubiquinone oxidoreductase subunit 5 (subunit L)/multisubunit Na+/H+ antiporter MnhA subunit